MSCRCWWIWQTQEKRAGGGGRFCHVDLESAPCHWALFVSYYRLVVGAFAAFLTGVGKTVAGRQARNITESICEFSSAPNSRGDMTSDIQIVGP